MVCEQGNTRICSAAIFFFSFLNSAEPLSCYSQSGTGAVPKVFNSQSTSQQAEFLLTSKVKILKSLWLHKTRHENIRQVTLKITSDQ